MDLIWKKTDIPEVAKHIWPMNLKHIGLELCTCTWLEIMTCVGITLYLLHLSQFNLAIIAIVVFSPLIGFHFVISKLGKADSACVRCRGVRIKKIHSGAKNLK
jgi:hypothetical protein